MDAICNLFMKVFIKRFDFQVMLIIEADYTVAKITHTENIDI